MASTRKDKTVDLPPKGPRNPDPITDAPGAHPIETGVGAALGGAAAGMAAGVAAGPIGAVVGTIAGAVAGGLGGKAVGEWIDPTTEDTWLKDNFRNRPYVKSGETFENYAPVYQYGGQAEAQHTGRSFQEIENSVRSSYEQAPASKSMDWNRARPAIQDAYERTCQIRKERGTAGSNNPGGTKPR
jgi:hypothetical protein